MYRPFPRNLICYLKLYFSCSSRTSAACIKLSLLSLTSNSPLLFSCARIFKKRKELPRYLFDILKTGVTIWRRAGYNYQRRKLNIFLKSFVS